MTCYSGFSHWKWWFSIAMLNYQSVLGQPVFFGVFPSRKYNDAWRPRGRNLIDTTNEDLMTFDLACNSSVVWNIFYFPFHIWDNQSSFPLTNSYFSGWLLHHQPGNILSTGAYFKKKAGRRSSVKRYFFVGYGGNSTSFLKYFKDHAAAQAGHLDHLDSMSWY